MGRANQDIKIRTLQSKRRENERMKAKTDIRGKIRGFLVHMGIFIVEKYGVNQNQ